MGRKPKKEEDRKTEILLIRLTKELKQQFEQCCKEEMIDMSIKARQLILQELNNKEYGR